MIHRSPVYVGLRVFIAGVLLFNSVALGAIKRGREASSETHEVVIGVRFGNGNELYFRDCTLVNAAVTNDEITSEGTDGCMGVTPLAWALIHYPDKVSTLLDSGADPNSPQNGGVAPLHLALSRGSYGSASLLLQAGADPAAVTATGITPLHALYQGCSSCGTGGGEESSGSRRQMASRIISAAGPESLDAPDEFGATPLYYAATSSSDASEKISELIELGADPEIRDNNGVPMSFYAALAGNTAASERLRILAEDPVGVLDDQGRSKTEWVRSSRLQMDEMKLQMKPEAIRASISNAEFSAAEFSALKVGCHFWLGLACGLVGGVLCTALCTGLTGPFAYLCGGLCGLGAALAARGKSPGNNARPPR